MIMPLFNLIIYVVAAIAIALLGMAIIIYNVLIALRNNVRKAWANIDVLLEKRHDLISRLVDVVKGYEKYERTVLVQVTAMRTEWMQIQNVPDVKAKMKTSNQISQALKSLFADVENYPDLKADRTFLELQQAITEMENQIADRREFYNDTVNTYNIKIQIFPFVLFSSLLEYKPLPFFQPPAGSTDKINVIL